MGLIRQSLALVRQARIKEAADHRKALAALEPQLGNYVSPRTTDYVRLASSN